MNSIPTTETRNRISEVWKTVAEEPVAILRPGVAAAVVVSPSEYERLSAGARKSTQGGFTKGLFPGVDWDEVFAGPAVGFDQRG